jgi:hypothetical protein
VGWALWSRVRGDIRIDLPCSALHTFRKSASCDHISTCLYDKVRMLAAFHCGGSLCSGACLDGIHADVQETSCQSTIR